MTRSLHTSIFRIRVETTRVSGFRTRIAPPNPSLRFTGPPEPDSLERTHGRFVVSVAAGDNSLHTRLVKRPREDGSGRLGGVSVAAASWDHAVANFNGANLVGGPMKPMSPTTLRLIRSIITQTPKRSSPGKAAA